MGHLSLSLFLFLSLLFPFSPRARPRALPVPASAGSLLSASEFQQTVIPVVTKLFFSNERAVRVQLLQHLAEYVHAYARACIRMHA